MQQVGLVVTEVERAEAGNEEGLLCSWAALCQGQDWGKLVGVEFTKTVVVSDTRRQGSSVDGVLTIGIGTGCAAGGKGVRQYRDVAAEGSQGRVLGRHMGIGVGGLQEPGCLAGLLGTIGVGDQAPAGTGSSRR
ncbi:hypothetical protein AQI70_14035 [Streptomyces curacoi]|uniref:Uncharacterized protein n=1 Tax=Streptomyces curacoi TaxID=146536 RepID=A0A117PCK6_9ACTN|nr:hypothetical protein AQI70_14035 [Streptomyces curacoi]